MFGLGVPELILILIIGLVIFGPGRLPDIGKAFGKSIREFKSAEKGADDKNTIEAETKEKSKDEAFSIYSYGFTGEQCIFIVIIFITGISSNNLSIYIIQIYPVTILLHATVFRECYIYIVCPFSQTCPVYALIIFVM